jgi:hypothetical protein
MLQETAQQLSARLKFQTITCSRATRGCATKREAQEGASARILRPAALLQGASVRGLTSCLQSQGQGRRKKNQTWLQRNRQQRVHETPHAEAHARTTAPATACPDGRSGQGAPTFPAASRTSIPSLTTAAGQEEGAATRAAAERGSRRVQQAASTPTRSVRTCPRPPLRVLLGAAPLGAFAALALPQHEPIQTARLGRARARGHHHTLPLRTAGLGCTSHPARQAACPRRLPAP